MSGVTAGGQQHEPDQSQSPLDGPSATLGQAGEVQRPADRRAGHNSSATAGVVWGPMGVFTARLPHGEGSGIHAWRYETEA